MKKLLTAALIISAMFVSGSCGADDKPEGLQNEITAAFAVGAKSACSDSAVSIIEASFKEEAKKHGYNYVKKTAGAANEEAYTFVINSLIENDGADLIATYKDDIMLEAINKASEKNKDVRFILFGHDSYIGENVTLVSYAFNESAFICGAAAAALSPSKGLVNIYEDGKGSRLLIDAFTAGAEYVNPLVKVISSAVGTDGEDIALGAYEAVKGHFEKGAAVVHTHSCEALIGINRFKEDEDALRISALSLKGEASKEGAFYSEMDYSKLTARMFEDISKGKLESATLYMGTFENGALSMEGLEDVKEFSSEEDYEIMKTLAESIKGGVVVVPYQKTYYNLIVNK